MVQLNMKKLIAIFLLILSTSACAQYIITKHPHGFNRYPYGSYWEPNRGWIVPAIVGGVVTYEIINRHPQYQQNTIQYSNITPQGQVCSEWREVIRPDGYIVYRERTCQSQ
jgi:hypothetical protein